MATNSAFQLIFDFFVDKNGLNTQLKQAESDIQAFNRRIKDETSLQFSLDAASLQSKLD
jgi:predicted  nucleic acid-binding Zn-ribbon protein